MWSNERFSIIRTTMWSMLASVPGEKSCPAGQSAGRSGTKTLRGPV